MAIDLSALHSLVAFIGNTNDISLDLWKIIALTTSLTEKLA